jgi:DNA-binding CsgD family transcriptional regulator
VIRDLTELTRAEILLVAGMQHTAFERAMVVADRCQVEGQTLVALLALHLCARTGPSAEISDRVSAVSRSADFHLARIYRDHAQAAEVGDGKRVGQIAAEYDDLGLRWLAGETAARSLALAGSVRTARWAIRSRRIIDQLDAVGDLALPAWWRAGLDQIAPLTQREREIAELAALGRSSPQIASQLHLSPRTIENHLQHSYRKLGVTRRQELARALGSGPAQLAAPMHPLG